MRAVDGVAFADKYDGKVVLEFVLHDAWPMEVAAANLSYDAPDVTQFDVTFRYSYHLMFDKATGD